MKYRHGDVLLRRVDEVKGEKLNHLVLAEGEVTGHKHIISDGLAELFKSGNTKYLNVKSETATLTHEEHKPLTIPQGFYEIVIQREYSPEGWKSVAD